MPDEGKVCPKCGAKGQDGEAHPTCIHHSEGTFFGITAHFVGVGWKCWSCGHEWGFDDLDEDDASV